MTKIELTRRRILGGLVTIGAGSAAAGAGTFALFSDTETSNGNELSAGTLNLQAGSSNTLSFSGSNIAPTDTDTTYTDLQKSGTVTADLAITVTSVSSTEGATPESEGDTSTGGELADQLELDIWIGTGGSNDDTLGSGDIVLNSDGSTGSSSNYQTAASYSGTTWSNTTVTDGSTADNLLTDFSGPVTFNVDWQFPNDDNRSGMNNNDAQGDDITVGFEFELVQQS